MSHFSTERTLVSAFRVPHNIEELDYIKNNTDLKSACAPNSVHCWTLLFDWRHFVLGAEAFRRSVLVNFQKQKKRKGGNGTGNLSFAVIPVISEGGKRAQVTSLSS